MVLLQILWVRDGSGNGDGGSSARGITGGTVSLRDLIQYSGLTTHPIALFESGNIFLFFFSEKKTVFFFETERSERKD